MRIWLVILISGVFVSTARAANRTAPIQSKQSNSAVVRLPPQIQSRLQQQLARVRDFYQLLAAEKSRDSGQEKAVAQMRALRKEQREKFVQAREQYVEHRKHEVKPDRSRWLQLQKKQQKLFETQRQQYVKNRDLYRRLARKSGRIPGDLEFGIQEN